MARLHHKDRNCTGLLALILKADCHDIAVEPAICGESSCRGCWRVLHPRALLLLGNASSACMLATLQVHVRHLLDASLPSPSSCLSAAPRQGQGNESCSGL